MRHEAEAFAQALFEGVIEAFAAGLEKTILQYLEPASEDAP